MPITNFKYIIFVLLIATISACEKSSLQQTTFQECVLKKVENASDIHVAGMLKEACAKKHQVSLPSDVQTKITGTAGYSVFGGLIIKLNNRNSDWIITEIQYYIRNGQPPQRQSYLETMNIEPLDNSFFFPSMENEPEEGDEFSWGIEEVWGVPVER